MLHRVHSVCKMKVSSQSQIFWWTFMSFQWEHLHLYFLVLDCLGLSWIVLDYLGLSWIVLDCLSENYRFTFLFQNIPVQFQSMLIAFTIYLAMHLVQLPEAVTASCNYTSSQPQLERSQA